MKIAEKSSHMWRIGEILIRKGLISWDQLDHALAIREATGRKTGEVLVQRGMVSQKKLFQGLADQSGMTFADLENVTPQTEALDAVPKRLAYEYHIMPLVSNEDTILIAASNPMTPWAETDILTYTRFKDIRTVLSSPEDIEHALARYYGKEGMAA